MRFPRRKQEASEGTAAAAGPLEAFSSASIGQPLLKYFLPVALVGMVAMLLLTLYIAQQRSAILTESRHIAARGAAESLAGRVSGLVEARRELLAVVANLASVQKVLEDTDKQALQRAATAAGRLLPGVMQVRLFPQGQLEPDPTGKAPLGFAGVDMARRALQGKTVPVEIHHIEGGHPYLAVARGVIHDGRVIGAVLGAWPIDGLKRLASSTGPGPAKWWLMQDGVQGFTIAASGSADAAPHPSGNSDSVAVEGTRWQVYYLPDEAAADVLSWLLWGLLGAGMLAVLVVMYLQQRTLARSLRSDFAILVSIGEAIANGEPPGLSAGPSVSISADPLQAMARIARDAASARPAATAGAVALAATAADAVPKKSPSAQSPDTGNAGSRLQAAVVAPASIFRAYDIRGVVDSDLNTDLAMGLGWAFAGMAATKGVSSVYVAHDPRLSSPDLYEALCAGLAECGMHVRELGMAPVALLYFAMHQDPDAGAIMVTGSHNPPQYNGFKLYLQTEPVHGEAIQELRTRMQQGGFEPRPGSRELRDLKHDYLEAVAQEVSLTRPLRIVVDGGNGAAGELASETLSMLGCEVVPLYCKPDGRFPNHHPDPGQAGNLVDLQREVLGGSADLGIALDGDGDRIGMVDDQGTPVRPEHLLMLLAGDILRRHPGSDVIYDVKSSRQLAGFVLAQGGRPIMWRSGHTRMKEKMRETGALLGGEFAGHLYIKERWYGSDDAIYVAARLLEVIADDPRPLHDQLAELPSSPASPEYQLTVEEGESAALMQAIAGHLNFPDARVIDLDGLRVEFPHAWGLVRASNTVPSLTFRFEADSEEELEKIMRRFRALIEEAAPGRTIPF